MAAALRAAGYALLKSQSHSPRDIAAAVRAAPANTPIAIISALPTDAMLPTWIAMQVSQRRPVLILGSPDDPVPGTRSVPMPATINEIMAAFGAPAKDDPAANSTVHADYSVSNPHSALSPEESDDIWEGAFNFDSGSEPASAPSPGEVAEVPEPPATPSPQAPAVVPVPVAAMSAPSPPDVHPVPVPQRVVPTRVSSAHSATEVEAPGEPRWRPVPATEVHEAVVPTLTPDEFLAAPKPASGSVGSPAGGYGIVRDDGYAPVIVCLAGKGGVGKSSISASLAQRACEVGGLSRVVLIDGNRGQGDLRKALRIASPSVPSIYDAALTGDPRSAMVGPKVLNGARDPRLPRLGFGMVMAPRDGQSDPRVVTAELYAAVLAEARKFAHLVVVDTQILEDSDTSGLWDKVWTPALVAVGGWGVGISDSSTLGVVNLITRVQMTLRRKGVGPERGHFVMNRINSGTSLDLGAARKRFSALGTFAGIVPAMDEIQQAFEAGRLPMGVPQMTVALDTILHRVTGMDEFDPERPGGPASQLKPAGKSGRFGWFRRGNR